MTKVWSGDDSISFRKFLCSGMLKLYLPHVLRIRVGFLQQGNKEEMHDPRSFPLSTASSVVTCCSCHVKEQMNRNGL